LPPQSVCPVLIVGNRGTENRFVDILSIVVAVERQSGQQSPDPLEYHRIINGNMGEPGVGIFKNSGIVRE
jgi:hypothetical protein